MRWSFRRRCNRDFGFVVAHLCKIRVLTSQISFVLASHVPLAPSPVHTSSCVVVVGPLSPAGTCEVISLVPPLPCLWAYYPCESTKHRGRLSTYHKCEECASGGQNPGQHAGTHNERSGMSEPYPCRSMCTGAQIQPCPYLTVLFCCCNS